MAMDIRNVKDMTDLILYFSENLDWNIDLDYFDDIDDIAYDFEAEEIGLKEEAFAKISSLRQLQPLVDGQKWGIFCVEFDSNKFEVSALRKILSGLVPKRRNAANHAVWDKQDLLFICTWGTDNNRTIGIAHFEDKEYGLPQIKMISCAPAREDFTQINVFEKRLSRLKWPSDATNTEEWRKTWASAFVSGYRQTIQDSSTLTIQLAQEAQNIRDRILNIMRVETKNGYVHLLYEKFKNTLIHDMTEQDFADMYAQTVVYGLFSARCMDETQDDFTLEEAVECIPNTNPFLKNLMRECIGTRDNSKLSFDELEISNVVELLRHTRTEAIIKDFNRQTGGGREDPVIHFYEEFLTAYDKIQKIQRGVFYTPQPAVNFIVSAVDAILKTDFGMVDGLASKATKTIKIQRKSKKKIDGIHKTVEVLKEVPAIQVLDPATGTGTFLRQVILQIYSNFLEKNKHKSDEIIHKEWNEYVDSHLLPRINGFELMMAPYAVAHMKLAMVLKDTGYEFGGKSRLNVYLTNSLEEAGKSDMQISLWEDSLATEAIEANVVKKNTGINIILGNPPYNNSSSNQNPWILKLLELYKEGLKEKKLNLDEDSIKFIRYGQELVERTSGGILAYISNNTFLNGVTHRKMRLELMRSFDKIYIVNLHGDSNRLEKAPDGGKDENIFDIKQGVSINIFVKSKQHSSGLASVYYKDVYGLQDGKLDFLNEQNFMLLDWENIKPIEPYYFFDNKDYSLTDSYEEGFSVNDLFIEKNTGIQTKNDAVTLCKTEKEARILLNDFLTLDESVIEKKYNIKHGGTWTVKAAKTDLLRDEYEILPILFRPFDVKYTILTDKSNGFLGRPRYSTMKYMNAGFRNYALLVGRQNKSDTVDSFFITDMISEMKCAERTIQSYHLPIYVTEVDMINNVCIPKANFDMEIVVKLEKCIGKKFNWSKKSSDAEFDALDVLDYIYAILYTPEYREKYKNQLKIDFPRVPYPTREKFYKFIELGKELRNIHLMKGEMDISKVGYNVGASLVVEVPRYNNGVIEINKSGTQITNVPKEIWNMGIGGYIPLQKWLKDRKGENVSLEDLNYLRSVVVRLEKTEMLMKKLSLLYEEC